MNTVADIPTDVEVNSPRGLLTGLIKSVHSTADHDVVPFDPVERQIGSEPPIRALPPMTDFITPPGLRVEGGAASANRIYRRKGARGTHVWLLAAWEGIN